MQKTIDTTIQYWYSKKSKKLMLMTEIEALILAMGGSDDGCQLVCFGPQVDFKFKDLKEIADLLYG